MLLRDPRALAFLLFAAGLGLAGWFGEARWNAPEWSAQQREEAVDLRVAVELQRRGPLLQPTGARLEHLRQTLRAELDGEIRRERKTLERWVGLGALLCMLGAGQFLKQRLAARLRI